MELLQVADAVAREKSVDRELILEAMEEAIKKAGRTKYGHNHDIRVVINRKSGEIEMERHRAIVEFLNEDPECELELDQLTLEEALRIKKDVKIGDVIIDRLPPLDFGRIAAQTAKQVIMQKVREAERQRQYHEYKDRVGEVINGVVKRVEYGNVTVDMGKAEGYMRRDEALPREHFKTGDRVRGYIYEVKEEQRGPQIFVSRTHPEFMRALFMQEVPEIYDGVIEIRAVSRDPGSRAKIAVTTTDHSIDPVGACVGMRGSRVQAVVNELQGEKIDIINWTEDTATFVVSALSPATVTKVVMDQSKNRLEVVVPDDQLSLAIGRRGQNVRLASMLSGWDIDILTEEQESDRRQAEFKTRSALFIEALDVDDVIASLLVVEGFTSIEEIMETEISELARIEGFDEAVGEEIKNRSILYLEDKLEKTNSKILALGIKEDLKDIPNLTPNMIITLGENGIKTSDDLGDLASDELIEIFGTEDMDAATANTLIMSAREKWFAEEDKSADADKAETEVTAEAEVKSDDKTEEQDQMASNV